MTLSARTFLLGSLSLLAACSGPNTDPASLGVQSSEPLRISQRADRTQAQALSDSTVSGKVYIFAAPPKTAREVQFYLDGNLVRREQEAPHDLMGGTFRRAKPLDTQTLKDGRHALRATLKYKNGQRAQVQSSFVVQNAPAAPPEAPSTPSAPTPPVASPTPDEPAPSAERWQPEPGTSWQWQLQGHLELSLAVDVYDLDLFDTPASTIATLHDQGKRVICYFSAGSFEGWRSDANTFPATVKGKKMDGWDELWLDIRNLEVLGPIMRARLELAAQKGCDGVEPDNVDAYANDSGFPLSGADQLAYNRFLAAEAHAQGLAVGPKNDLDQVRALEPYFDFAVNEECFQYDECDMLTPFINAGKAVFGAEYESSTRAFCPITNALNLDFIKKRYDLDAYRESCR